MIVELCVCQVSLLTTCERYESHCLVIIFELCIFISSVWGWFQLLVMWLGDAPNLFTVWLFQDSKLVRGSSPASIMTELQPDDQGSIPGRGSVLSLCHVQTSSGIHPSSCPVCTSFSLSLGVMQPKCEAGHWPPSSTKVRTQGAVPSLPFMSAWAWCLVKQHRNNLPIP
jgi:hypothetical protein